MVASASFVSNLGNTIYGATTLHSSPRRVTLTFGALRPVLFYFTLLLNGNKNDTVQI